jgi:lathosterol oxidase
MKVGIEWAHYILCYLRNFVGAMIVYYVTAGVFHYYCYVHPMSLKVFEEKQGRTRPTWDTIKGQIKVSQVSLTIYTMLPVLDEFLIVSGYTKVYYTIDDIGGWVTRNATMIIYFCCVKIGIYWMHRTLHTNKWLYQHMQHLMHHTYKSPETLTPWASIVFHRFDGMLQAYLYVLMLPFVPCHYLTHFGLLFFYCHLGDVHS